MLMVYLVIIFQSLLLILKRREICLNLMKTLLALARNLLCDTCVNLLESLSKIIFSQEFLENSRQEPSHFIRNRILFFPYIILFFCNFIKSSYQTELNKFFNIFSRGSVALQEVSKVALCKARKKIKHEAFLILNEHATTFFYANFSPLTWKGLFLRAIDGSTVQLPNEPDIADHFGAWNPRQGDPCTMARISQMFDPLNHITVDAIISPKSIGERDLAAQHFQQLRTGELLLLDRGYPAFWLFKMILTKGANFCSRISISRWHIVRDFIDSGKQEEIIVLTPPTTAFQSCNRYGLDTTPMTLRLIRIELETGESEVLITSLTDVDIYPMDEFAELYITRWPVEEDYKIIKRRIEVENFTGKSKLSVYQDFHARVFSKNITAMLTFAAQKDAAREISTQNEPNKKINSTQALSTMRDTVVLLLCGTSLQIKKMVSDLFTTFLKATEPIRPGRKYLRNHKAKRKFYINYKPIL